VKNKYGKTPNKKENIYFRVSLKLFRFSFFIINNRKGKIIIIIVKIIIVIIKAYSLSIKFKNKNNSSFFKVKSFEFL
jgi:dolichol kinase